MRAASFFVIVVLMTLLGCHKESTQGRRVGVDPFWFPLSFGVRDHRVTGFSTELLTEIGKRERIPFVKINVNSEDLMDGLQKNEYEAILSSIPPYTFNQAWLDFSENYLSLGPVLVVPALSKINSLDHLEGKEIAVISGSSTSVLMLEKSPGVLIRYYDAIPNALNAILMGTIDGAILDVLSAVAYCRDLYQGELRIATEPLNNEGLRLITKHKVAPDLIKKFNHGLSQMKKDGSYFELLDKWGLQESLPSSKK